MAMYPENLYRDISLDELVVFTIFTLLSENKEATFENIVAKCFELFPDRFSLIGYPQWPDSARVNKSWLRCRTDFKYIKGSVKSGFAITSKGLDVVERIQKKLNRPRGEKVALSLKRSQARTKEEHFLNDLENSSVFKRFLRQNEETQISHYEFCDMLYCTLESSSKSLLKNLRLLQEYAHKYKKQKVIEFLDYTERLHSPLLTKNADGPPYEGGMNKMKLKEN